MMFVSFFHFVFLIIIPSLISASFCEPGEYITRGQDGILKVVIFAPLQKNNKLDPNTSTCSLLDWHSAEETPIDTCPNVVCVGVGRRRAKLAMTTQRKKVLNYFERVEDFVDDTDNDPESICKRGIYEVQHLYDYSTMLREVRRIDDDHHDTLTSTIVTPSQTSSVPICYERAGNPSPEENATGCAEEDVAGLYDEVERMSSKFRDVERFYLHYPITRSTPAAFRSKLHWDSSLRCFGRDHLVLANKERDDRNGLKALPSRATNKRSVKRPTPLADDIIMHCPGCELDNSCLNTSPPGSGMSTRSLSSAASSPLGTSLTSTPASRSSWSPLTSCASGTTTSNRGDLLNFSSYDTQDGDDPNLSMELVEQEEDVKNYKTTPYSTSGTTSTSAGVVALPLRVATRRKTLPKQEEGMEAQKLPPLEEEDDFSHKSYSCCSAGGGDKKGNSDSRDDSESITPEDEDESTQDASGIHDDDSPVFADVVEDLIKSALASTRSSIVEERDSLTTAAVADFPVRDHDNSSSFQKKEVAAPTSLNFLKEDEDGGGETGEASSSSQNSMMAPCRINSEKTKAASKDNSSRLDSKESAMTMLSVSSYGQHGAEQQEQAAQSSAGYPSEESAIAKRASGSESMLLHRPEGSPANDPSSSTSAENNSTTLFRERVFTADSASSPRERAFTAGSSAASALDMSRAGSSSSSVEAVFSPTDNFPVGQQNNNDVINNVNGQVFAQQQVTTVDSGPNWIICSTEGRKEYTKQKDRKRFLLALASSRKTPNENSEILRSSMHHILGCL